jgi:hypothetical protein
VQNKAREKVKRDLALAFPEFTRRGGLFYSAPAGDFLKGMLVEGSSNADCFYLWVFVQLTILPTDHLDLSFGKRLESVRKPRGWNLTDPDMFPALVETVNEEALPFLNRFQSVLEVAAWINELGVPQNIRNREAAGVCYARAGRVGQASQQWAAIEQTFEKHVHWQTEIAERARSLRQAFNKNQEEGQAVLDSWRDRTKEALNVN